MARPRHTDCPVCHTKRGPYFRPGQLIRFSFGAVTVGAVLTNEVGLALAAGFITWLACKAKPTRAGGAP